ncbi:MAG: hypothetical protein AAF682_21105 [Planctomycetota bacterium]
MKALFLSIPAAALLALGACTSTDEVEAPVAIESTPEVRYYMIADT